MTAPEEAARSDISLWRRDPAALERLELGRFDDAPPLQALALRAVLAARLPAAALAAVARGDGGRRLRESYRYWRAVRRLVDRDDWRRLTRGTTILLYHAVGTDGERPSRFVVPRRRFERQMRWIARRRPVIGLGELVEHRRRHRLPPAGAVAVTFDDGYADNRTLAAPVLRRLGVPATIFVVTDAMGGENRWLEDGPLAGRPLLTWSEAAELRQDGLELGAHSRTHQVLRGLPPDRLDAEVAGARADLLRSLGEPVEAFAYPGGKWNAETAEAARRAGFACACTIRSGRNGAGTPPHALRRLEVVGSDSFLRFALSLAVGDREVVQRIARRARAAVRRAS